MIHVWIEAIFVTIIPSRVIGHVRTLLEPELVTQRGYGSFLFNQDTHRSRSSSAFTETKRVRVDRKENVENTFAYIIYFEN